MSAFVSEYPGVVRAIVTDIGVVTDLTHAQVRAVRCKALWDTGAVYSVISNGLRRSLGDFLLTNKDHSKFVFRIPAEG